MIILYDCTVQPPKTLAGSITVAVKKKIFNKTKQNMQCNPGSEMVIR